MNIKEYLEDLNTEDACGFAIDSFPTTAHKKPFIGGINDNDNYDELEEEDFEIDD